MGNGRKESLRVFFDKLKQTFNEILYNLYLSVQRNVILANVKMEENINFIFKGVIS